MATLSDLFLSQSKSPGSSSPTGKQEVLSVLVNHQQESGNMSVGTGDTFDEPFTLISSTAESLGAAAASRASSRSFLGHISAGKDWIASKHSKVQPWSEFFNIRKISKPNSIGEGVTRVLGNLQLYQSNYLFVFLGLLVYCM